MNTIMTTPRVEDLPAPLREGARRDGFPPEAPVGISVTGAIRPRHSKTAADHFAMPGRADRRGLNDERPEDAALRIRALRDERADRDHRTRPNALPDPEYRR